MAIIARPLTAAAFAPYGQVLEAEGHDPARHDFAARLASARLFARPNLAFMRMRLGTRPVLARALERHPGSSQAFVPMGGTRYLVLVVAKLPTGDPDLATITAFVASGEQAINYDMDVWHHPMVPLAGPGAFAMLRWDERDKMDTLWHHLAQPLEIQIPD